MAVNAGTLTASMNAYGSFLRGPVWFKIAGAVGLSVQQWVLSGGITLNGATTGTLGGGTVQGKVLFTPTPLATLPAFALVGPNAGLLSSAIGLGVFTDLNLTATYTGVSVGVGAGADASKVTRANIPLLSGLLTQNLAMCGIFGQTAGVLAPAVASGIATIALTGVGTGVVLGTPSPSFGGGTSISKVI